MDEMLKKYEVGMQTLLTEKDARIAVLETVLLNVLDLFVRGSGDDSTEYHQACIEAAKGGVQPRIFPRDTIGAYFAVSDPHKPPFPVSANGAAPENAAEPEE